MPNHCFNRVKIYNNNTNNESISLLHEIFSPKNETESIFGKLIPEPEWSKIPLSEEDVPGDGEVGELPVLVEDKVFGDYYKFKSTDCQDCRWYQWRIQNWATKWDCYSLKLEDYAMPESFTVEFETAWSPPEPIFYAIKEKFDSDLSVSWFYDEPGCEIAGYLGGA